MTLGRSFYARDTVRVARALLGKVLVHQTAEGITSGRIVETEAYLGAKDPASRAARGRTRLSSPMWGMPGSSFVYMVHGQWLFNVVTERVGKAGAVLIRALEPLTGIELMRRRRGVVDERALTSGPGRLTQAMGITRADHLLDLTDPKSHLRILAGPRGRFRIARSHRIGVSQDLPEKLRFFISGNLYVSR